MYDFHYKFIKIKLDAVLLFFDTDSFTYETKSEDVYEELLLVLRANLFVLMINLVSQLLFTKMKVVLINSLKQFLKRMNTVKN